MPDFNKAIKSRLFDTKVDPNAPPRKILRNNPIKITDERVLKMINFAKKVKKQFVPHIDEDLKLEAILNQFY